MCNAVQSPEARMEQQSDGHPAEPSWSDLVARIQAGDISAMEQLYRVFSTGIRFYLCRQLGPQDLDDRVHDAFLTVTQSIRRGDLREPERLMGYVRTVIRRQVAAQIDAAAAARCNQVDWQSGALLCDRCADPERKVIERQRTELALRILKTLPWRDREVLIRFYLREQQPAEICVDMGLTETQFRLIKSRAKARFGKLGKARMERHNGFRGAN